MSKLKTCSFCNKNFEKLWYSNPKCCSNYTCKQKYHEEKNTKTRFDTPKRKDKPRQVSQQIRSKKIQPFNKKKLKELSKYRELRNEFLSTRPICEIKSPKCTGLTTELHHSKPRAHYLCDVSVFVASCRACNSFVESNHEWAEERGFKQRHTHETNKK